MFPKSSLPSQLVALILLFGSMIEAKVVVLFSVPHVANVRTHTNVGRRLTEMGHEAYVCIPQTFLDEKTINTEGVKVIPYGRYLGNPQKFLTSTFVENVWRGETEGFTLYRSVYTSLQGMIHQILSDDNLVAKLKEINADLFVTTSTPVFLNIVVLPYMLDLPFAFMSPFHDLMIYRVPFSPPATSCQVLHGFNVKDRTFTDRLKSSCCHFMAAMMRYFTSRDGDKLIAEFAPHRPQISVTEVADKADIFLVESDNILDFAKPGLPNMKLIGGTAATPGKPLTEPFKSFVEGSKHGVAVVTFGSAVVNIPEHIAVKMASAFQKQDLDIVWRVNYSSPDSKKILTSNWIPQNDILAHRNTKLFVSHCGANGQYEALFHGVPMLCLPLFGDQPYNAHRSTSKGFGLKGNILELSDTELAVLMMDISGNTTFGNNIKKASTLFRQLHKVPNEEAAFWIDHVMEYGGSYMRSAGQDMPLYQYLALDILALIGLVLFILVLIIYKLIRCCYGLCRRCCKKERAKQREKRD